MIRVLFAALAVVSVFPATSGAQSRKPVVAIYQMDDLANSGQAKTFSTMIETAVSATSKFRVIERENLGRLVGEQARAKGGLVRTNTPGRIGGFEGADYLIYGSITTLSIVRKSDIGSSLLGGMMSGNRGSNVNCSGGTATLGIDIKITDSRSGEVRYVTRIDEKQKMATVCDGSTQVNGAALLRSAADKVATGLVTAIYPIQIAAVQSDGVIVLNYGEGAVTTGAVMAVFTKGAAIRDPATGEVIANDEQRIGLIQITDVTGRVSKATAYAPFASPPTVGAIVRPASATDLQSAKGKRRK